MTKASAKKPTIKAIVCDGIKAQHTADRILKAVVKHHPDAKTDESHIRYYSNYLKRQGEITEDQHLRYVPSKKKPAAKTKEGTSKKATVTTTKRVSSRRTKKEK